MFGRLGLKKRLTDILNEQSENLIKGEDRDDMLLEQNAEEADKLERLFRVANRVATTLAPVDPSEEFTQDLKERLYQMQAAVAESRADWDERRMQAMKVSRVLGMVISVLAIAALATRIVSTIVRLVAFITDRRRKTPAAA